MTVKKTVIEEGDELPTHRTNIIHKRVVSEGPSLEDLDLIEATTGGIDEEFKLEVWYVEKDTQTH